MKMIDKNIKNEVILASILNENFKVSSYAKKYNIGETTIRRWISNINLKKDLNIYLIDEENISLNLFEKYIQPSNNDIIYIITPHKNLKTKKNYRIIKSPPVHFKDSLDYRLMIELGKIMNEFESSLNNYNINIKVISNDKIYKIAIDSIQGSSYNISLINICKDIKTSKITNIIEIKPFFEEEVSSTDKSISSSIEFKESILEIEPNLINNKDSTSELKNISSNPIFNSKVDILLNSLNLNNLNSKKRTLLKKQIVKSIKTKNNLAEIIFKSPKNEESKSLKSKLCQIIEPSKRQKFKEMYKPLFAEFSSN